ncbi:MAG: hypothetical protein H6554_11320 [Chitinophagales bacterium]|nr:hypothetical protein [Chitinophagales bacterium]
MFSYQRKAYESKERLAQIEKEKEREILKASINAQEQVRRKIGADLHDDLGPSLSIIKFNLGRKQYELKDRPKISEELANLSSKIDEVIFKVRNISKEIETITVDKLGLEAALIELIEQTQKLVPIQINYEVAPHLPVLSREISLNVIRIIQELISNTIKHSEAQSINLNVGNTDKMFFFQYSDNGIGIDQSKLDNKPGIGLKNIQARSNALRAKINFHSALNEGVNFSFEIPLENIVEE